MRPDWLHTGIKVTQANPKKLKPNQNKKTLATVVYCCCLYFCFSWPQTPGPAAYKVVDPSIYGQKPPQFSMTGRNFTPGETTAKPGPGAYNPEQVRNLIMSCSYYPKCSTNMNIFYSSRFFLPR